MKAVIIVETSFLDFYLSGGSLHGRGLFNEDSRLIKLLSNIPSDIRKYVLWHEWVHVRISDRWNDPIHNGHKRVLHRLHDIISPLIEALWHMTGRISFG